MPDKALWEFHPCGGMVRLLQVSISPRTSAPNLTSAFNMLSTEEVSAFCQPHLRDWLLMISVLGISKAFVQFCIFVDVRKNGVADDTVEDDIDRTRLFDTGFRHGGIVCWR